MTGRTTGFVVGIGLALTACASKPPPVSPTPVTTERQAMFEMRLALEDACQDTCEKQVLGECVLSALTGSQPDPNCVHDRALACLLNCTP